MDEMKQMKPGIQNAMKYGDWFLGIGVILLLMVLLLPLPPVIIDLLVAFNLSISIFILLITTNTSTPLELSSFPSILLFTTLIRLAVNVATTRAILMRGDGGSVVRAFGDFVIGGNLTVGVVVFVIIMVINFVVITKGSGRISEVAARFTLDSMPGRQMAIDADLNAGNITQEEANARRLQIQREAEFFGSMDGASKFVRGDAVAGLIIIIVNVVGGVVLGWTRGMPIVDALKHYVILTVGDGLVSQIPTLLISVAAGILVTKANTKNKLADEIGLQLLTKPRAMAIGSGLLAAMAMIPGLPAFPFLAISGVFAFLYSQTKDSDSEKAEAAKADAKKGKAASGAQSGGGANAPAGTKNEGDGKSVDDLLAVDRMSVEIGYRLIPLVDPDTGTGLLDHIAVLRRQFALNEGVLVPPIRIKDNIRLDANAYRVLVGGQEVAGGRLLPGHFLAMDGGSAERPIGGIDTTDPSFGLPAKWIPAEGKDEAELFGYTVVDPVSVLVTHLSEIVRSCGHEILSRDDVKHLLDNVKKKYPAAVDELVPNLLSVGDVQKVLRNLLRERVPIRNLPLILESLADHATSVKDPEMLTELVRQRLSRALCESYSDDKGKLYAVTLDPGLESKLASAATARGGAGDPEGVNPAFLRKVVDAIGDTLQGATGRGREPVLLAKAQVRRFVRDLIGASFPRVPVLSYTEITPAKGIESLAVVKVD